MLLIYSAPARELDVHFGCDVFYRHNLFPWPLKKNIQSKGTKMEKPHQVCCRAKTAECDSANVRGCSKLMLACVFAVDVSCIVSTRGCFTVARFAKEKAPRYE